MGSVQKSEEKIAKVQNPECWKFLQNKIDLGHKLLNKSIIIYSYGYITDKDLSFVIDNKTRLKIHRVLVW